MAGKVEASIEIVRLETETMRFAILGTSPLIMNRMAQKAWQELLLPKGKKTAAEKATSLKHDPLSEYRASPYRLRDPDAPTELGMLSTAFKGALRNAALDMPGAKKSQIGRLCYVPGEFVGIYGVPQIFCAITRSADMNRTPDVRTRAIVPTWAAVLEVTYSVPMLKRTSIQNLVVAAGINIGIGDWRPEKGAGNYGQFTVVDMDDPRFVHVVENGGRAAQLQALEDPTSYNEETDELLAWFNVETRRRGFTVAA